MDSAIVHLQFGKVHDEEILHKGAYVCSFFSFKHSDFVLGIIRLR